MSAVLFSTYVGLVAVIIVPVLAVVMAADYYRAGTRRERLQLWQAAVLTGTTGLAIWTHFWVQPSDGSLMIATTPLWVFCGIGIVLSLVLAAVQFVLTQRQRQLEARLIRLVRQP